MGRIVIVGGGVTGSSTAYHLALAGHADRVSVVEPDPTYALAASPKATGGVRVLFSVPENIRMSLYGRDFYADFDSRMAVGNEPAHVDFRRAGYLFMAGPGADAEVLEACQRVQTAEGARVLLLDRAGLRDRFPSLVVDDVEVAAWSPDDGYLDPHGVLMGFRRKAASLGVTYVQDRVVGIETTGRRVRTVRLESGGTLDADWVVNAANCWAPEVCAMVGMRVPVAPMRRMNFWFECRTPLEPLPLVRHTGKAGGFRPEGTGYLSGYTRLDEPRGFNWEVEHDLFDTFIWPALAQRVRAFEAVKVRRAWACHYDQNDLDANLIIGPWPGRLDNFLVACGLSGHGLMHAPAIGRALTEWMLGGRYETLDLTRLGYQRVVDGKPLAEAGAIS
ncbi:MAG: FAD-binding oxidoreductase [Ectothiorhodospiraceae bacterium]|nr:FAD-binding oxidoreductase [Ectothiorhodospiraceae bacterium]